jgi:hypothetical protein
MLAAMVSTETSLAVSQTFDWQRSITGQINDLVTEGSSVYVIGNTGAVRSGNAFVRKDGLIPKRIHFVSPTSEWITGQPEVELVGVTSKCRSAV